MPIFYEKAGTLRLGFSEKPYRDHMTRLWIQMALLALGILLLAFAGSLLFIRRITGPLTELARAANEVDRGELDVRVKVRGRDEVAALGTSFNHMISSLQTYTRRLEEQAMELKRAMNNAMGTINTYGHTTVCQGSLYFTCKAMSDQFTEGKFTAGSKFYWQADTGNAEFILFVGANPYEANYGPPLRVQKITQGIVDGRMKIAVVTSRTARRRSRPRALKKSRSSSRPGGICRPPSSMQSGGRP